MSSCSDEHDVNGCNSIQVGRPVIYNHHQLIAITDLSPNRGVAVALRVGKPARGHNSQLTSLTVPPYTSSLPTRRLSYKPRRAHALTAIKWLPYTDGRTDGLLRNGLRSAAIPGHAACKASEFRGRAQKAANVGYRTELSVNGDRTQ